jgi:hypothetical protein
LSEAMASFSYQSAAVSSRKKKSGYDNGNSVTSGSPSKNVVRK